MKRVIYIALLLGVSFTIGAKELSCTKYQKFPVILPTCNGEAACGDLSRSKNKAIAKVDIYEEPFKNSKIIDYLDIGEIAQDPKPYLVINELGKLQVNEPTKDLSALGVKVGDILPLVQYFEQDIGFVACIGEELIDVYDFQAKVLQENKTKAWVKLKTPRDFVGYTQDIGEESVKEWYKGPYS